MVAECQASIDACRVVTCSDSAFVSVSLRCIKPNDQICACISMRLQLIQQGQSKLVHTSLLHWSLSTSSQGALNVQESTRSLSSSITRSKLHITKFGAKLCRASKAHFLLSPPALHKLRLCGRQLKKCCQACQQRTLKKSLAWKI